MMTHFTLGRDFSQGKYSLFSANILTVYQIHVFSISNLPEKKKIAEILRAVLALFYLLGVKLKEIFGIIYLAILLIIKLADI